jgi:potassium-transporting ATPase ATP-binding subunit
MITRAGGTPLAVAKDGRMLGVIQLKDIVKGGIRERFAELRRMGKRSARAGRRICPNRPSAP